MCGKKVTSLGFTPRPPTTKLTSYLLYDVVIRMMWVGKSPKIDIKLPTWKNNSSAKSILYNNLSLLSKTNNFYKSDRFIYCKIIYKVITIYIAITIQIN